MSDLIEFIRAQLSDNQFAAGGVVIAMLSAALVYLRSVPGRLWSYARRLVLTTVEVQSDNRPVYWWLLDWLEEQPVSKRTRTLSVRAVHGQADPYASQGPNGGDGHRLMLTAGPGGHFLFYRRRPVWLSRVRKEPGEGSFLQETFESFQIVLLSRDRDLVQALFEEAREVWERKNRVETVPVYSANAVTGWWDLAASQRRRSLDTIVLPDGALERLTGDWEVFLRSDRWYMERGIPWRRGCLFYGPPGTGKTSVVRALAGHFRLSIAMVSLGDPDLTDSTLLRLLGRQPDRSVLLIEDVDAAGLSRDKETDRGVTMSGLLNALDGAATQEGRILVLTTNHPERLDRALVRPGRVDVQVAFDYALDEQIERMYRLFGGNGDYAAFRRSLPDRAVTAAEVQARLIQEFGLDGVG